MILAFRETYSQNPSVYTHSKNDNELVWNEMITIYDRWCNPKTAIITNILLDKLIETK